MTAKYPPAATRASRASSSTVSSSCRRKRKTGALDSKSGKEVLKLFRKLNDMGNTIVMITHDLEVAKAAKRVVKIVDGEIFAVEN